MTSKKTTTTVGFRVTHAERIFLVTRAKRAGLKLAEYLKGLVFAERKVDEPKREEELRTEDRDVA